MPPSYPCTKHLAPDSPRSFASASNPASRSTPTHPRERPSKTIAAQNCSPSDSAQAHLQNHAASASQLSMYKASCAGFTTLLRFGINPAPRSSARTPFKNHRRTKPLSIRFRASPATLCHPAPSAGFAAFLRFGIKPCAALNSHASARTPFKKHRRTNRSSSDSAQPHLQNHAASAFQLSIYKASCAGFTTLLRLASTLRSAQLPRIRANALQKPSPHKTALYPIPRKPSDARPSRPQRRIHRIPLHCIKSRKAHTTPDNPHLLCRTRGGLRAT